MYDYNASLCSYTVLPYCVIIVCVAPPIVVQWRDAAMSFGVHY